MRLERPKSNPKFCILTFVKIFNFKKKWKKKFKESFRLSVFHGDKTAQKEKRQLDNT